MMIAASRMPLAPGEKIVDLFAGGGGASQGIFLATGRHPDIAINHDEDAVAVHTRNHPDTHHHCISIWKLLLADIRAIGRIGLLWASPDCRHFSRASGGRPKSKSVRSLPGVVLTWAKHARPRVILVENVIEMLGWGPLLKDGTPCPDRVGRSFRSWVGRLLGLGYAVQWRELCAADYGAPTIRTRLVVQARCDGVPIVWPEPTHSRAPSLFAPNRWRAAAECIDWSIPCPSIFTRPRPLVEKTMRRLAQGIMRYVIDAADPFLVPLHAQAAHISALYGTSTGYDARSPLGTIMAQGGHEALVSAFLAPITHHGENRGSAITSPAPTITCANRGEQALVCAFLPQHNGNGVIGRDAREPVSTLTTRGTQTQLVEATLGADDRAGAERVAAFLLHYFGSGKQGQPLDTPLGSVTTHDRYALVTVSGVRRPIVDIGMRMLSWRELARAQSFSDDYDLTDGGRLTKTKTVHLIGNSVPPVLAQAVVAAAFPAATSSMRDAA